MPVKARRNGIPAYQRIQGVIRKNIDSGGLRPGDAVPSERELARIHDVSLMTARHALATLEQEGFVERRRGVGTIGRCCGCANQRSRSGRSPKISR